MAEVNPNDFYLTLVPKPMFSNGPSQADQFGDPYQAVPVEFFHTADLSVPNTSVNAARIASTEQAQSTWTQRLSDFWQRTKASVLNLTPAGPLYTGVTAASAARPAAAAAAKNAGSAVSGWLWKAAFVIIVLFVGYFFLKTVAVRYAGKVV